MDRLFAQVKNGWGRRKEITSLNHYLKNPVWCLLQEIPSGYTKLKKTNLADHIDHKFKNRTKVKEELTKISKIIKRTAKTQKIEVFEYNDNANGICYPFMSEHDVFGYLVVCGFKKVIRADFRDIFCSMIDAIVRDSRKEIELEDINKTIRPRAIALSTVHTVHRLMTSTLDLNELLPRVARLTLQVLRSNRCSIKLVDKKRKTLIPKTTIDLRKSKIKLKKVQIGKYAPGRAVKRGTPIRGKNYLATPMIDRDVVGVITLYDKLDGSEFTQFDEEIMKTLGEQAAIAIRNAQIFGEQQNLTLSSIKCISQLLAKRSNVSHRAEGSFLKLISTIGPKFDMNEREIRTLQYAAMLHDAGQISIPEKLLMKKHLTGKEFDIVKRHPMTGASILSQFKPLRPIVPIMLYHHENFDGSGYPKGLKGKEIPLAARILALVGTFEAMITEKPYRKALSISRAIREIRQSSGKQFDPKIVNVFCEVVQRKDVKKLLARELGGDGK